jgi:hypothetical protein
MPGPYAHITLLHQLIRPGVQEALFPPGASMAELMEQNFRYCALGAVSPDYPNLAVGEARAAQWADAMHYTRTGDMIASGIRKVSACHGEKRAKLLAWLLGYTAHVVTDATIHPVVLAKVGPYATNQRQHRICEMNQDGHIFRGMGLGEIGESAHFAESVAGCGEAGDRRHLDGDVLALWRCMLAEVHPELYAENPPDIALWHRAFVDRFDRSASAAIRLFPLAENISAKMDLAYPRHDAVDRQYVEGLVVPLADPLHLHYDQIFARAVNNVADFWKLVERGTCCGDPAYLSAVRRWNLDNGLDEEGRLAFWE